MLFYWPVRWLKKTKTDFLDITDGIDSRPSDLKQKMQPMSQHY